MASTIFEKLSSPFAPSAVSWRVGSVTKKDPKKASALCYVDARDVMARFDEACGPGGWQDSYIETPRGRIICTISIKVGDAWVSKSDGAGDTAVEGEKGGISDAFKRAAVKWGVGRYLYSIPTQWVQIDDYKQILASEKAELSKVLPGSVVFVTDDGDEAPTEDIIRVLSLQEVSAKIQNGIRDAKDLGGLGAFWKENWPTLKGLPDDMLKAMTVLKDAKKAELSKNEILMAG